MKIVTCTDDLPYFNSREECDRFNAAQKKAKLKAIKGKLRREGAGLRKIKPEARYCVIDLENGGAVAGVDFTVHQLYRAEVEGKCDKYDHVFSSVISDFISVFLKTDEDGNLCIVTQGDGNVGETEMPIDGGLQLIQMGNRLIELGSEVERRRKNAILARGTT